MVIHPVLLWALLPIVPFAFAMTGYGRGDRGKK
jgi:hypothetical protein